MWHLPRTQFLFLLQWFLFCFRPSRWLSDNAFVSGAEGPRFKSRTVKSDTVLPTACHRCITSSKGAVLPGRNDAEMGSQTRYTLRRNTASNERKDMLSCFQEKAKKALCIVQIPTSFGFAVVSKIPVRICLAIIRS